MELKALSTYTYIVAYTALNRTRLELKDEMQVNGELVMLTLNRTRLELKDRTEAEVVMKEMALNRTRLELKVCGRGFNG